ncbi:MAG: NAD(P)-binding domain-containing protein [Myxococcota bacterium]
MMGYEIPAVWIYLLWFSIALFLYRRWQGGRDRVARRILRESLEAGLTEPPSLHPVIDPIVCAGCGTCVRACPEKNVLGLVDRKAVLISPANCIGHGACKTACPVDAITLVFGTKTRGIELPVVKDNFETNVPGLFIAGELGGMGLIRNAIEQGRQAMESIMAQPRKSASAEYDVVIVGAGPAGFAASLTAHEKGIRYATIEQEDLGGTVAHFPRGKLVMTAPVKLPSYGMLKIRETTKEELLALWKEVEQKSGVGINYGERVEKIQRTDFGFEVQTSKASYRTQNLLLALGRRGTPRKLGVPGEDLPKVVYRMVDPAQYRGQHVLVVGGGDSALEAATSIAEESGATVTLSYRSAAFSRAKPKNRNKVDDAAKSGTLRVLMNSNVAKILEHEVYILQEDKEIKIPNDAIIVCAGGVLPTGMLKSLGIEIVAKYGEP